MGNTKHSTHFFETPPNFTLTPHKLSTMSAQTVQMSARVVSQPCSTRKAVSFKSNVSAQRISVVRPAALKSSRNVVMMSAATDEIIEKLQSITLLEASELVKQIEETFGVDASAPAGGMMMAGPMPGAGGAAEAEAVEEKTEFDCVITEVDASKRIAAIKVVRSLSSLGLKEAKDA